MLWLWVAGRWWQLGDPALSRRELVMPYFTLFVDVVLHMMDQFPAAFEFRLAYVHRIWEHAASCQYGTKAAPHAGALACVYYVCVHVRVATCLCVCACMCHNVCHGWALRRYLSTQLGA
jgi:hypothetical protein